jgi:type III restriction enzyme
VTESKNLFFERPILNSPYDYPNRHWELNSEGQPTQTIVNTRRQADFITPIPAPKKKGAKAQKKGAEQEQLIFDKEGAQLSKDGQQYDSITTINALRRIVDEWRKLPNQGDWNVTPETARLLQHWRGSHFSSIRPFFCQVEAVEVAIWLTEVANKVRQGQDFLDQLNATNADLPRLALKLATGAGKTTVMAMLIAWQTINAVRRPSSSRFTRGFLIVTPGITIRDRLRVLKPNDPDSYYDSRELVPADLLPDLERTKVIITNYHAFKQRERMELSKGGRALLQGRGESISTVESEGQMLQRVMPELMGLKSIMVLNDEAHHCYREKAGENDEENLKGDDRKEAQQNTEAARLWISGIEAVQRKLGISRVFDLSATPFFLRGSGYSEGTLFPWTMSDFSLMDAIECGIVKLPRVPVADNIPDNEMPRYRNLWEHIGKEMPKSVKKKGVPLDPQALPTLLQTALEALYGHYKKTHDAWQEAKISAPPCFIIVCNNTVTSKLIYDYVSGFDRENPDGSIEPVPGKFELFRNTDEYGNATGRPNTLLIDSLQIESGDQVDKTFKEMASAEIERFRYEMRQRGDLQRAEKISDENLLREVMNTVGKEGRLGGSIRCVVSVSMLTEGWDANTVTHVLGVRAFGTQLLCEQVIGRALRRQSYDLNEEQLFNVEYADVLGIPFDFTAKAVTAPVQKPRETIHVRAVSPERDHLEIQFPRVLGYRTELPQERLTAEFSDESRLELTPELVGPSLVNVEGIIGQGIELTLEHTKDMRRSTLVYHLASRLMFTKWRDAGEQPKIHLHGDLRKITKQWLDNYLVCKGGTYPAQLLYQDLADMACERITAAITRSLISENAVKAVIDSYNPTGSTMHVNFTTSKEDRWQTSSKHCHVNWAILDSEWEGVFCQVAESHESVLGYVKNHNLGLEVPYRMGSTPRIYIPDFILRIDDGQEDLLNLIVEIKGYRGQDAIVKKETMETYWVPGVNNRKIYGRWAFTELADIYAMHEDFERLLTELIDQHAKRN